MPVYVEVGTSGMGGGGGGEGCVGEEEIEGGCVDVCEGGGGVMMWVWL